MPEELQQAINDLKASLYQALEKVEKERVHQLIYSDGDSPTKYTNISRLRHLESKLKSMISKLEETEIKH